MIDFVATAGAGACGALTLSASLLAAASLHVGLSKGDPATVRSAYAYLLAAAISGIGLVFGIISIVHQG